MKLKNKLLSHWTTALLVTTLLCSCHTNYLDYDTDMKDGLYFSQDSINYKFGMGKGEDFDYLINLTVLGQPRDYDREFSVELIEEESTAQVGLHYEIEENFIVKAGNIVGGIPLVLHRYKDPQITEQKFVLKFRIIENNNFRPVMATKCIFEFSDEEIERPDWWEERYMGSYSQMLMMDILNSYWELEYTHPLLFERIVEEYGRNFEKALSFPYQQQIAILKYVLTPVYQYYQEHPHPRVNMPDPSMFY